MKLIVSTTLMDFDGKPILRRDHPSDSGRELTIRMILLECLNMGEPNVALEDYVKRHELALLIHAAKNEIDLREDDINVIKRQLPKPGYGASVVGGIMAAIKAAELAEAKAKEEAKA